jgi:hypothetical protein
MPSSGAEEYPHRNVLSGMEVIMKFHILQLGQGAYRVYCADCARKHDGARELSIREVAALSPVACDDCHREED